MERSSPVASVVPGLAINAVVISDITGWTGLAIIDAILKGERDPFALAKLRHGRIKASGEVKVLWVGTRKVKCRAATSLRMAAQSLHHSKSGPGDVYPRMRAKLGAPK